MRVPRVYRIASDVYIVGWMQERTISAPDSRTTYLGARFKNDLSRRPVEERPISAPDSRTTYLKRDFCFSDFVVAVLRDFKIRFYRHQT